MNYLLDTHVFLWMLSAPGRLSAKAQAVIQNPDRAVYVSAVKRSVRCFIVTGFHVWLPCEDSPESRSKRRRSNANGTGFETHARRPTREHQAATA